MHFCGDNALLLRQLRSIRFVCLCTRKFSHIDDTHHALLCGSHMWQECINTPTRKKLRNTYIGFIRPCFGPRGLSPKCFWCRNSMYLCCNLSGSRIIRSSLFLWYSDNMETKSSSSVLFWRWAYIRYFGMKSYNLHNMGITRSELLKRKSNLGERAGERRIALNEWLV